MRWVLAVCLLAGPLAQIAGAHFRGGPSEVMGLAVTPDGRTLLVAGMDGRVRLVDLPRRRERGSVRAHKGGVWALALAGDGRHFLTGGADQVARIWELANFKEVQTYEGHARPVSAVALSADGRLAATGDYSGAVHVWEAVSGEVRFRDAVNKDRVTGLAFSDDGKLLAGGGVEKVEADGIAGFTRGSQLCLWQVPGGAREVLDESGEAVHFLPGRGGLVASGSTVTVFRGRGTGLRGGSQMILWDPWRKRRGFTVKNYYHGQAVSADGRYVATSWGSRRFYNSTLVQDSAARGIHLWELASRKEVWARAVREEDAGVIAFTPDGRTLIAGRYSGTLDYHDLRPDGWRPPARWGEADFQRAWQALGGENPALAYAAVWDLGAGGDGTVRWLRKTWKPVSQEEKVRRLLRNLDGDDFAARQKARQELAELAEEAEPALWAALEKPASAELKRAARELLARLNGPASPARLRQLRVLSVLERIGTAEARQLLQDVSKGPPGPYLREQARLAEARVAARAGGEAGKSPIP